MKLNRSGLREHENKILLALADYYYEHGYKSEAYVDPDRGGIYEHKFANRMGYKLVEGDKPPHEFTAATMMLEAQGYVRRIQRNPNFPIMGVWPTLNGLDRADYLKKTWYGKISYKLKQHWAQILVSVITTLITLILSSVFGLFGLGDKKVSTEAATEEKLEVHSKSSNSDGVNAAGS